MAQSRAFTAAEPRVMAAESAPASPAAALLFALLVSLVQLNDAHSKVANIIPWTRVRNVILAGLPRLPEPGLNIRPYVAKGRVCDVAAHRPPHTRGSCDAAMGCSPVASQSNSCIRSDRRLLERRPDCDVHTNIASRAHRVPAARSVATSFQAASSAGRARPVRPRARCGGRWGTPCGSARDRPRRGAGRRA